MAPGDQGSQPPLKRRKVAESCKLCRTKKTRCDGRRPECSPCAEKGVTCEYNDATVAISASSLADIEARLQRLEQRTAVPSPQTPTRTAVSDNPVTNDEDGIEGTFVEHATTNFIREITQVADSRSSAQAGRDDIDIRPVETNTASMVIPTRAVADDLLSCFETFVYPLFPVLHMPTFRQGYARIWEPQSKPQSRSLAEEVVFHATLNVAFALGCLNNSNIESPLKLGTANTFYQRTRTLLPLDALDTPSLEVLQCLLLTTIYLMYTKYSHRCANTLAVAIRNAQALRLHVHIDPTSSTLLSREMKKRVWHQCLILERLVSSIFGGKPVLGIGSTMPLPQSIDDDYLVENGNSSQPAEIPSIIDAFIVSARVFEVMDGVRKIDYSSFDHSFRLPELTEVLQLNEKLDEIERNLPSHLQRDNSLESSTARDRIFHLQAEAVMVRILHVRLLLLRPHVLADARQSLLSPTATQTASSAETALRSAVSTLSVQSAVGAIDILHTNLHSPFRIVSANAAFVTLSAATVIIAASLVPELNVSLDDGENPQGHIITKALQVLEEHQWQVEGARGARKQLKNFLETARKARQSRNATLVNYHASTDNPHFDNSQLSFGTDSVLGGIDFNDPLWNLPWSDATFLSYMPGSTFDLPPLANATVGF